MLRPAHHRAALQNHHVERNRHGRLETVHHITQTVTDQDDVAIAVDQRRGVSMI
jgi:hypothetical protein